MNARVRALIAPGVATTVCFALLIGLGAWQLRRLAWKEALIAAAESRAHAAPVDPPTGIRVAAARPGRLRVQARSAFRKSSTNAARSWCFEPCRSLAGAMAGPATW